MIHLFFKNLIRRWTNKATKKKRILDSISAMFPVKLVKIWWNTLMDCIRLCNGLFLNLETDGKVRTIVTWDQALFSFRFVNNVPVGMAKRKESLIQTFYERLPPTFLIDWHLPNQPTKITSVACFSSMQIFHTWKNADWLT